MKSTLFARIYSLYALLVFVVLYLIVFPFHLVFSVSIHTHKIAIWFNRIVAWGFLLFTMIPVKMFGRENIPKGQFIICANHFSYMDIPALGLIGPVYKFFGKASLSQIPLFGWMYKRLHVTVDRASFKSRAHALSMAREMVEHGFNMAIFPEGGVRLTNYPEMAPFRDGAFRLAVEYQIPILPVTMPRNHTVWPYDPRQLFYGGRISVHIHPPVYPQEQTEDEIIRLKEEVRSIMQESLDMHAVSKDVNIAVS